MTVLAHRWTERDMRASRRSQAAISAWNERTVMASEGLRIHHVDLAVSDVSRSLQFYLTLLGPCGLREGSASRPIGVLRRSFTSRWGTRSVSRAASRRWR